MLKLDDVQVGKSKVLQDIPQEVLLQRRKERREKMLQDIFEETSTAEARADLLIEFTSYMSKKARGI